MILVDIHKGGKEYQFTLSNEHFVVIEEAYKYAEAVATGEIFHKDGNNIQHLGNSEDYDFLHVRTVPEHSKDYLKAFEDTISYEHTIHEISGVKASINGTNYVLLYRINGKHARSYGLGLNHLANYVGQVLGYQKSLPILAPKDVTNMMDAMGYLNKQIGGSFL